MLVLIAGCVAPGGAESFGSEGYTSDEVFAAPGASGEGFGDPTFAINGVRGAGDAQGSTDVYSLSYPPQINTELVLGWSGLWVTNGPGVDFVVFENGFQQSGTDRFFMDLMIVEVSQDAETWVAFPHDYSAEDETRYEALPRLWDGFAGRTPTRLNVDSNDVDPFDTEAAGGDGFDLETLPEDDATARAIKTQGFRYVRLVAAPARENPDTGAPFVRSAVSNGPDIDGVIGRYLVLRD